MKHVWLNYGLTIVLFVCFAAAQTGMSIAGWKTLNDDLAAHRQPTISYGDYLVSDEFLEATMENWESEFLQMFAYVIFTVSLFQRGSVESKTPGKSADVDADPRLAVVTPQTPWPVRKGGWILHLYEYSLSLTLFLLFLVSLMLHALGGAGAYNNEQMLHGQPTVSTWDYLVSAQFWFESLQNWQSEFFSIGAMVFLTVFLRQRGSPESKPVAAPHWQNE